MSGFDVSVLEGKDRAELVAIAESLGEKVGARAKKADILGIILKAAGVGPAADGHQAGLDVSAANAAVKEAKEVTASEADPADGPSSSEPDPSTTAEAAGRGDDGAAAERVDADGGPRDQDGPSNEPHANQSDGELEGVESGNRRRRRRGRDRDRNRDENEPPAEPVEVEGMVELRDEGYGFLRLHGYLPSRDDAYV